MLHYLPYLMLLWLTPVFALDFNFTSGEQKTTVVELYTSEGCSSCPPADAWLSDLRHDHRLFQSLLPMAFHVDYWDRLGWKDRFARRAFSQRQYALVAEDILSQAYTPGLVVDSNEWRQWFSGQRQIKNADGQPGKLSVKVEASLLTATFKADQQMVLNVAFLGMGLRSKVTAGENRSKQLQHDFVVLNLQQRSGNRQWQIALPAIPAAGQQETALAVWLAPVDSLRVVQAAASWWPGTSFE